MLTLLPFLFFILALLAFRANPGAAARCWRISFLPAAMSEHISKKMANAIGAVLLAAALPWVLGNESRPILGSKDIFNSSRLEQRFIRSQQKHSHIGMFLPTQEWEYPI